MGFFLRVPVEIVLTIFDFLSFDHEALRTCCLVNDQFLSFSRRLLFRSILIDSAVSCANLHDLVQRSPDVALLIQAVEVSGHPVRAYSRRVQRCTPWWLSSTAASSDHTAVQLSRVIAMARNIVSFTLSNQWWGALNPLLRDIMSMDIFRRNPPLQHLKLSQVSGLPLTVLAACTAPVITLSYVHTSVDIYEACGVLLLPSESTTSGVSRHLRSLHICDSYITSSDPLLDALLDPEGPVDVSTISNLSVDCTHSFTLPCESISNLVRLCAAHLHSLHIAFSSHSPYSIFNSIPIDLSCTTHLQHLHFECPLNCGVQRHRTMDAARQQFRTLPWIIDTLRMVESCSLREVKIALCLDAEEINMQGLVLMDGLGAAEAEVDSPFERPECVPPWTLLDHVVQRSPFSNLFSLAIEFRCPPARSSDELALRAYAEHTDGAYQLLASIASFMPQTTARGILSLSKHSLN
ncbi:hypothetical protein FISHEDRAFT_74914 [Fistulina hepatica ATCC 64428]|uniref:F-box domain-containing protein n=1 Tax=Fistulina hepatica ATCC 64428 TaxID=1128425 RepID=A0A0D7A9U8_9AGAR|nr:hypothetical protein FISHEDRAFT_74914 [Fistulina hepatica ATCC 64428]